ncbi:hypothetical protein CANCADRAFT_57409 [Tortispora caseinolytica NRRL Y-17796]|uniref:Uncharacterized protein n=1 Tax=Tortispora caseinolytica NRRL Y-17796 TaxID=767744 RepID=A0A1E4TH05_9ASCO|nr:hypothetical protein CANCADRAFT_57409 [Tortispora caseinolytica NRRL Y-17796]
MSFERLFRKSRIAALPETLQRSNVHPVQQLLAATPEAKAQCDWGLKRTMPLKANKYKAISVRRLEEPERFVDYRGRDGTYLNAQRLAVAGIPFKSIDHSGYYAHHDTTPNPLIQTRKPAPSGLSVAESVRQMSPQQKKKLLYKLNHEEAHNYKKWLESPDGAKAVSEVGRVGAALRFLDTVIAHQSRIRESASAGLSYTLPGAVRNTPNGIAPQNLIPARISSSGNGNVASVLTNGFVSAMPVSIHKSKIDEILSNDKTALLAVANKATAEGKPFPIESVASKLTQTREVLFYVTVKHLGLKDDGRPDLSIGSPNLALPLSSWYGPYNDEFSEQYRKLRYLGIGMHPSPEQSRKFGSGHHAGTVQNIVSALIRNRSNPAPNQS